MIRREANCVTLREPPKSTSTGHLGTRDALGMHDGIAEMPDVAKEVSGKLLLCQTLLHGYRVPMRLVPKMVDAYDEHSGEKDRVVPILDVSLLYQKLRCLEQ